LTKLVKSGACHTFEPPRATDSTTWTLNRSGQPYGLSSRDHVCTTGKEPMLKSTDLTTNADSDWIGVLRHSLHVFDAKYLAPRVISMRVVLAHRLLTYSLIFRYKREISLGALGFGLWVLEIGILMLDRISYLSTLPKLLLVSEVKNLFSIYCIKMLEVSLTTPL